MIRKATVLDLPAVKEIYNYAVLNTTAKAACSSIRYSAVTAEKRREGLPPYDLVTSVFSTLATIENTRCTGAVLLQYGVCFFPIRFLFWNKGAYRPPHLLPAWC